jgi:hypothetical protein
MGVTREWTGAGTVKLMSKVVNDRVITDLVRRMRELG